MKDRKAVIKIRIAVLACTPDAPRMVVPLSDFLFQPVLHNRCNTGRGMYYPVSGMVHINDFKYEYLMK